VGLRMKDIEERHKAVLRVPCPSCKQMALTADVDARCLFCGFAEDGETAAASWIHAFGPHVRPGEESAYDLIRRCPECEAESFVKVGLYWEGKLPVHFYCFSCGESGKSPDSYTECLRCGELLSPSREYVTTCKHCFDHAMEED
jgi:hypothetical protein